MPTLIRWPGVIKPGTIYNNIFAHEDSIPTFAAAAGNPNIVVQCLKGCQSGAKSFKVHLDGYILMPFFKGEAKESPRQEFLYWSDDGDLLAIRVKDWKITFREQEHAGLDVWRREFTNLRVPLILDLRADPFERGPESFEHRTNGWQTGHSSWSRHRPSSLNGSRASRSSRSARSPRASISTR